MEHGHGHAPTQMPFSQVEWNEFRAQDAVAGKMVGGLMASIFSVGIVIYSIVLWSTLS
jgi:hypothetical protein